MYVLIIGAKSDIAIALARVYAQAGYNLYLAARKSEALREVAADLKIRHQVEVECLELDVIDYGSHEAFFESLTEAPIGVISVAGYLGVQEDAATDFNETRRIIEVNYLGIVSLLNVAANAMEAANKGFIIGISSVAGLRGRKKNYLYGSAKSALTTYLSGLRNRLASSDVHVLTVLPGFVYTKMTEGMELPAKLTATPESVAKDIYKAQVGKKNVIYTKWFWRWIMLIIRLIPEWKFKKMNI